MKLETYEPGPIQTIKLKPGQPSVSILRLDLIRSWATGNKYFKLKYTLQKIREQGISTLVSKGGMFSNHLAALAGACRIHGIQLIALVRSFGPDENNPSIQYIRSMGGRIEYLSPDIYRSFDERATAVRFPDACFIPEGGLNQEGLMGTAEIMDEITPYRPTHIVVAGGTMGTACGLIASAPPGTQVIVVPAWKGCTPDYVEDVLDRFSLPATASWEIWPDHHFGGYGRFDERLIHFMTGFTEQTGIPLDPVYTGKMLFAITDKIKKGWCKPSDHILAIHTGGLQGLSGFAYRFPEAWSPYVSVVNSISGFLI